MPELPEVETVRRGLAPRLAGRSVTAAWGSPSPKFASASELTGATFGPVGRRGKYLLFDLCEPPFRRGDGRQLVVHLGMTGQLSLQPARTGREHVRAWWELDDGATLELHDVRQFGRATVVAAGRYEELPTLAAQGPEPWDEALDGDGLWRNLRRSRAHVKTQLLSQRPIAGVGNIYADEALWAACVNPAVRRLSRPRAARLLTALRDVLETAIEGGGTTFRDYRNAEGGSGGHQERLACYGRAGQPCLRCGATLARRVLDGRGTTWCRTCQQR